MVTCILLKTNFSKFKRNTLPMETPLCSVSKRLSFSLLFILLLGVGCHVRDRESGKVIPGISVKQKTIPVNLNLYIDNSGSIDGYLSGSNNKGYKTALTNLYGLLSNYAQTTEGKTQVNFINSKIFPVSNEAIDFQDWSPTEAPFNVGGVLRKTSKINGCLSMILDSTRQNTISVFISDCIYSLDQGNTNDALGSEMYKTRMVFLNKLKEFGFSTIIIQLHSKFSGTYYSYDNSKTQLSGDYRPYYIWLIVPDKVGVSNLLRSFDPTSLDGFENICYLSDPSAAIAPYYTILPGTDVIGSFSTKQNRDRGGLNNITTIEKRRPGPIQFAVAINLKELPVDGSQKLQPSNYLVYPTGKIKTVHLFNETTVDHNDYVTLMSNKDNVTHFLTLSLPDAISTSQINISYSANQLPEWVNSESSTDDRQIKSNGQLSKTFGLSYLIQGVQSAYKMQYPTFNSYFSLKINLQ